MFSNKLNLSYIAEYPQITNINPYYILETQPISITVSGNNFNNDTLFYADLELLESTIVNSTQVIIDLPSLESGTHSISVIHSLSKQNLSQSNLFVFPTIQITQLFPQSGYENDVITILGTNFINTKHLSCVFNDTIYVSAQYFNPSLISCQLPQLLYVSFLSVRITVNMIQLSNNLQFTILGK